MKYPIESVNFAGRLVPDDLTILNEAIPLFVPETVDINDDKALTGRVILMSAVEKAMSNVKKNTVSLPKDQERIAQLEKQMAGNLEEFSKTNQELLDANLSLIKKEEEIQDLKDEIENLRLQASENGEKAANLEKYKPRENEMRLDLPPLAKELLIRYARKVSKLSGKEVTPGELLVSLFVRYITAQDVELDGFPLIIKKSEMKAIQEQLKKANEPAE